MPARRTVLDELFGLLSPERLLRDPLATGQGISVCIVDSGVESSVVEGRSRARGHEPRPVRGGVFAPGRSEPLPYAGRQSAPHGTTVADIMLSLAPGVELYSADVFGAQGGCDLAVLVHALDWAVDVWRCKVINLSLGVPAERLPDLQRRHLLQRAVERAYYKDVVVVAAAHNDHPLTESYPAAFAPPLLSVDKGQFDDPLRFAYRLAGRVEFQAHGRGYLGPFASEPATSWAAPHLAAVAARILSLQPDLKPFEVKTILYWLFRNGQAGAR